MELDMNAEELEKEANKMMRRGTIAHLKNGQPAIAISLGTTMQLPKISRQERKQILYNQFYEKLNELTGKGLEVDFDSISTSGQTVDAKLSVDAINSVIEKLEEKSLSVYPIQNRQVI